MVQPNGCGWTNAVRIREVGGAEIGLEQLTCETATGLALWVEQDVQPLAVAMFGSRVVWMQDMGTYSCRNIIGNKRWVNMRSQHSLANAVDIGGFRLANGKQMSISRTIRPTARKVVSCARRTCAPAAISGWLSDPSSTRRTATTCISIAVSSRAASSQRLVR